MNVPERISTLLPEAKLIVMLRHPVDRAYSQFGFVIQRRDFRGSFEEFVASRNRALEMGFYSRHLERYLDHFDRSQILPMLFEEAVSERSQVRAGAGAVPRRVGTAVPGGHRSSQSEHRSTVPLALERRREDRSAPSQTPPGIARGSGRSDGSSTTA